MRTLVTVLASAFVLSGCAYAKQQANLAPTVSVIESTQGQGMTVAVRVVDERPSKSLGNRGTAYGAAAEITSVQEVAVVRSEPSRIFDREAIRAAQRWRFEPRRENGVAVESRVRKTVSFRLGTG